MQKWAAIFYNNSDTLTTKADIQDGTKGQSPVRCDKILIIVKLPIC